MESMTLNSILGMFARFWARMLTSYQTVKEALRADSKGWWICAAVLLVTVVRSGITYSFGMFVVELQDLYHKPLAEQNWIGTLSFCISLSMAPVSVAFIRALKYRGYRWGGIAGTVILSVSCMSSSFVHTLEWMFLTHSLLYGVGSSLVYMASSLVIGDYFDKNHKYHVLATSILLCGYPIGSLIFNPINAWLVTSFGWRVAFRVASILIMITGLGCCWTFSAKDTPNMERLEEETESIPEVNEVIEEEPKLLPRKCCTFSEIKERPEIVLWYISNGLSYLGFFMPFMNLAYYMDLHNIHEQRASFALTMLSFSECITYIIAAFLGDYFKGRLIYVNAGASACLAVTCLVWPFIDVSYAAIVLISMVMGGFLGLTIVYTYAASGEVTELPIDIAWSFTNFWSGLGILVGPFFTGAVYDFRKQYDDVFYVIGCIYVVDAILFALIPILQNRRRRRNAAMGNFNEFTGIIGTEHKQTFKIPQRSVSITSLKESDGNTTQNINTNLEYGTVMSSELSNIIKRPAQPQANIPESGTLLDRSQLVNNGHKPY